MSTVLGLLQGFGEGVTTLSELLKQGVEYSKALEQINDLGIHMIPQVSDKVFEYTVKSIIPQTKELLELPGHYLPNIASIPSALTKTLRNFSYLVQIEGESQFGGQVEQRYISISTNSLLTKDQAIDAALSISGSDTKSGGINGNSGEVHAISQNAAGLTNVEAILPAFDPTELDSIVSPTSRFSSYKEQIATNRSWLRSIAQGPVVPVLFTESGQVLISGKRVTPA